MRREIKFRAWDATHQVMLEVYNIRFGNILQGRHEGPKSLHDCGCGIDAYILMQFTGLHDRHGKEIYEGDVVRESDNDLVFAIEWDAECAMYKMPKAYDEEYTYSIGAIPTELKVVGNIYESPELLKV